MSRAKKSGRPAYRLIQLIWDNTPAHSFARLNRALQAGLTLAIESRMKFDPDDFAEIDASFPGMHWMGSDRERWFTMAVLAKNTSACVSFEAYAGRKCFRLDGRRLYVGAILGLEDGDTATVTSFGKDGESLLACTHSPPLVMQDGVALGSWGAKVVRRVRLSYQDVRALDRAAKG